MRLAGLHLTRRKLSVAALSQEIDEPDNGIEWGAQLVGDVGEEFTLHPIFTEQLRQESLELLCPLHQTAGLTSLVPQHQSKPKNCRERNYPPKQSGPKIK